MRSEWRPAHDSVHPRPGQDIANQPPRGGYGRREGGFTLLELLTIVAAIGVLRAILPPAMRRAREHSQMVLCRGKLRNLGIALGAYAAEKAPTLPVAQKLDNPQAELVRALGPFAGDGRNFYCPGMTDPDLLFTPDNFQAGIINCFYYSCQQATADNNVAAFLRQVVSWPRLLDLDWPADTWVMSDACYSNVPAAHRSYLKGVNYLLLDGSVRAVEQSPRQAFR